MQLFVATFSLILALGKLIQNNMPATTLGLFLPVPSTGKLQMNKNCSSMGSLVANIPPTDVITNNGAEEDMRPIIKAGQTYIRYYV